MIFIVYSYLYFLFLFITSIEASVSLGFCLLCLCQLLAPVHVCILHFLVGGYGLFRKHEFNNVENNFQT